MIGFYIKSWSAGSAMSFQKAYDADLFVITNDFILEINYKITV